MFDDVCAFAGSVADEEARALLEVFCEAGFVNDGWGGFGELLCAFKHGGVDLHAAGVDHRDDEAVWRILGFARDGFKRLRYECVERADCDEGLAGAEAEAFGCGYAYA